MLSTKPVLIAALILFTAQLAFTQPVTFERYYDFDYGPVEQAYCVEATQDGGYVMCGRQGQVGVTRLLLFKVDSLGNPQGHKTYGFGGGWAWGYAVKQTTDQGYVVTGLCTDANNATNVFVAKCDQNGDTLWSKKYDPWDAARAGVDIAVTDTGYVVLANAVYQADTLYSAQLLFLDSSGGLVNQKVFTKELGVTPCAFRLTADGGYLLAAYTNPSTSDNDIYLIRTDAQGDTLWTKTIQHPPGFTYLLHRANCINSTSDGGFIITGTAVKNNSTERNILLIKTDEFGDTLWTKKLTGMDALWGSGGGIETQDGGFIVAGIGETIDTSGSDGDGYLAKTDAYGEVQWAVLFGGEIDEFVNYFIVTADSNFAVCGMETSWGDGGGVYLIKTDSTGYAQSYITSVKDQTVADLSIALYPNPVSYSATVSIAPKQQSNATFTVVNTLGETVQVYYVSASVFSINKGNLPPGVYLGVYTTAENPITSTIKFIIH